MDSLISAQEAKQAQAKVAVLVKEIEDKLNQPNLESWYQYNLEDLLDDVKNSKSNQLTVKQVKSWQEELAALNADFGVAAEVNIAQSKICRNSFFKPVVQQPVWPEPTGLLQSSVRDKLAS